jgi:hypothetical protein
MDFAEFLRATGLELPSPAYIAGAIVFGLVGLAGWRHGRRKQKPRAKWLGLALMLYPYVVPQTWLMYAVGAALTLWLYFAWD